MSVRAIKIILIFFVSFISFFFVALPQADACSVNVDSTARFRTFSGTAQGYLGDNFFDQSQPPFIYLDFKTTGCSTVPSGTNLYVTIFGIKNSSGVLSDAISNYSVSAQTITENDGGVSIAFVPNESVCSGDNSDETFQDNDCLIGAIITDKPTNNANAKILLILGHLIRGLEIDDAQSFLSNYASAAQLNDEPCSPSNFEGYVACRSVASQYSGFLSVDRQKFVDYYNNILGNSFSILPGIDYQEDPFSIAFAKFAFSCDNTPPLVGCQSDDDNPWLVPSGGLLPYGETYSGDSGPLPAESLPDNYQDQYIPLAPLPFEGLDGGDTPTFGQYLAGLFQAIIIIIIIIAVIMIVVSGIAYMASGIAKNKQDHRERIWNALIGLVIALGSWLILNTINPDLASELSVSIPEVELDGPDPAWQGGNAPVGTQISSSALLNGQPILQGMPWPDDTAQRSLLASAGVSVVSSGNSNCTPTAGTPNCTSVYFDNEASGVIDQIINFKQLCGCEVIITGGSEAWLHMTHGPNKKVVDFRSTTSLNQYLNGLPDGPAAGNSFPAGSIVSIDGVGQFFAEPSGATGNTTAKHWHVTFE